MNWRNVLLIFQREVIDQLRDRRTLFMVAVLPVLLYPLLGIGTAYMTAMFAEQPRTVVILGAKNLPQPSLLEGNHFSQKWFRSPGEAQKLIVITDLPNVIEGSSPESRHRTTSLLEAASQLRTLIDERQKNKERLANARKQESQSEIDSLEQSLQITNEQLNAQFDRSQIQVLVVVPAGFASNVERRQAELEGRGPSDNAPADAAQADYARPLIVQNSANEKSAIAFRRVTDVIRAWERAILSEQLRQSGLPATLTTPINPTEIDLAERRHVSANVWSKIVPFLLVIMTLTGAFYPAVDLCAGEKERGTMETLLICPATRTEIVLGKFLTVLLFSMTTAILNLISVGMTGKYMSSLALGGTSSPLGDLGMPPVSSLFWVFVILIPLSTLFCALCLALATFAKSSKEGQYYLSPLLMVTLGLMMFCLSPGTELNPFFSVMPVIGPGLLLKGLLKANGPDAEMFLYILPVLSTSLGYSLLAIWWAIEQFGSEEILFGEAEQFDLRLWVRHLIRDRGLTPTFAAAGFCFLLIVLLQFASWKPFQAVISNTPHSQQGIRQIQLLMAQQVATIAVPSLLMGILFTTSLRETFSFRWPGWLRLACAGTLPFALHPLILETMAALQSFFPPAPSGIAELMKDLKSAPLGLSILAIAITPALCEELAFRGFLLSGFRRKGKILLAILLSSFAFGIIHMIPQQVFNAMLLGVLLGTMCVRTRSLWPGVFYHFVHNSLVLLHDRFGGSIPTGEAWNYFFRREGEGLRYQPAMLVLALLVSVAVLRLLLRRSTFSCPSVSAADLESEKLSQHDAN